MRRSGTGLRPRRRSGESGQSRSPTVAASSSTGEGLGVGRPLAWEDDQDPPGAALPGCWGGVTQFTGSLPPWSQGGRRGHHGPAPTGLVDRGHRPARWPPSRHSSWPAEPASSPAAEVSSPAPTPSPGVDGCDSPQPPRSRALPQAAPGRVERPLGPSSRSPTHPSPREVRTASLDSATIPRYKWTHCERQPRRPAERGGPPGPRTPY